MRLPTAILFLLAIGGGLIGASLAYVAAPQAAAAAQGLAFGAPHAWAGVRSANDTQPNAERVVIVDLPYTYHGGAARVLLTLFVADDAAFSDFVGIGTGDLALDATHATGTAHVVARVHAGGILHWQLTPSVLSGSATMPPALEGALRFNETM
ncbi:MAG: hypothetical protein ACYDCK_10280 [Thermoplasmatota archaeon]